MGLSPDGGASAVVDDGGVDVGGGVLEMGGGGGGFAVVVVVVDAGGRGFAFVAVVVDAGGGFTLVVVVAGRSPLATAAPSSTHATGVLQVCVGDSLLLVVFGGATWVVDGVGGATSEVFGGEVGVDEDTAGGAPEAD